MDAGVQVYSRDLAPLLKTSSPIRRGYLRAGHICGIQKKTKCLFATIIVTFITVVFLIVYKCPQDLCSGVNTLRLPSKSTLSYLSATAQPVNFITYDAIQQESFEFDINGTDVMVFLHIQKTGGTTFGKHLVQDIDLESPCECRKKKKKPPKSKKALSRVKRKNLSCDCFRPGKRGKNWLFSRYSTGWRCGLHADYTELTECVDHYLDSKEGHVNNRRYFYITYLREPVSRYLSEYRHVHRGGTWKAADHTCNGRPASEEEIPKCYRGDDWAGVQLEQFLECGSNLASNRQTRMLADLRLVNCYNATGMSKTDRDERLLESAKDNLLKMSFFGFTELQLESQAMFEEIFNLKFKEQFVQYDHTSTQDIAQATLLNRIRELNSLDLELYKFAHELMLKRLSALKTKSPDFRDRLAKMIVDKSEEQMPTFDDDTEY